MNGMKMMWMHEKPGNISQERFQNSRKCKNYTEVSRGEFVRTKNRLVTMVGTHAF